MLARLYEEVIQLKRVLDDCISKTNNREAAMDMFMLEYAKDDTLLYDWFAGVASGDEAYARKVTGIIKEVKKLGNDEVLADTMLRATFMALYKTERRLEMVDVLSTCLVGLNDQLATPGHKRAVKEFLFDHFKRRSEALIAVLKQVESSDYLTLS